jgi:hypothetical protein
MHSSYGSEELSRVKLYEPKKKKRWEGSGIQSEFRNLQMFLKNSQKPNSNRRMTKGKGGNFT